MPVHSKHRLGNNRKKQLNESHSNTVFIKNSSVVVNTAVNVYQCLPVMVSISSSCLFFKCTELTGRFLLRLSHSMECIWWQ